jgi:hypothetical protein
MKMRIPTIIVLIAALVLAGCSQSGSQARNSGTEQSGPKQSGARTAPERTPSAPQSKPQTGTQKAPLSPPQIKPQPAGQSIPGLNAASMARIFEQQGLGCKRPRESGTLYNCTSEGNPSLSLLYVGQVTGSGPKRVSSVAAEVVAVPGGGDLTSAAQEYLGVVARRIDYQGADASKAGAFVAKNLSGTDSASITIGSAKWSLLSNAEVKVLEVASPR